MERFFIVCGAGGAGCGARYLISLWAGQRLGTSFPYGTLIVNVIGSFLIAVILELALRRTSFSPNLQLALTTGFMGGLTTYSSFNYETTSLLLKGYQSSESLLNGATLRGLANVGITLFGCLGAGLLGLVLARRIAG